MGRFDSLFSELAEFELRTHIEVPTLRRLQARIPGLVIATAQGVAPFTSEGSLHGLPYYFRYRGGHASLRLGDDLTAPLYSAEVNYGHHLDGSLEDDEFFRLMILLVSQLRRAPRLWEFVGVATHETPSGPAVGERMFYGAWGTTPEEAFAVMHQYPADMTFYTHRVSPQQHLAAITARQMNPETATVDQRVWPDPEPRFEVLSRLNPRYWGRRLRRV